MNFSSISTKMIAVSGAVIPGLGPKLNELAGSVANVSSHCYPNPINLECPMDVFSLGMNALNVKAFPQEIKNYAHPTLGIDLPGIWNNLKEIPQNCLPDPVNLKCALTGLKLGFDSLAVSGRLGSVKSFENVKPENATLPS